MKFTKTHFLAILFFISPFILQAKIFIDDIAFKDEGYVHFTFKIQTEVVEKKELSISCNSLKIEVTNKNLPFRLRDHVIDFSFPKKDNITSLHTKFISEDELGDLTRNFNEHCNNQKTFQYDLNKLKV